MGALEKIVAVGVAGIVAVAVWRLTPAESAVRAGFEYFRKDCSGIY